MLSRMTELESEQRAVFSALKLFLRWCRKQGLIERNPCEDLDRDERPKPARRDHVPTIKTLRAVWTAVEGEPQRDLIRLLLLTALRRNEVAGLRWSEVDLERRRL